MAEKRVKVRVEHRRKIFYERFLASWKEETEDRNQAHTLWKARENLKRFPLEVDGIAGLKKIMGIGDTLAVRCDAAWNVACSNAQSELSLREVKAMTNDDFRQLVNETKNAKRKAAAKSPKKAKSVGSGAGDDEFTEQRPAKAPRLLKTSSAPSTVPSTSSTFSSSLVPPSLTRQTSNVPPPSNLGKENEFMDSDDDIMVLDAPPPASSRSALPAAPPRPPPIPHSSSSSSSSTGSDGGNRSSQNSSLSEQVSSQSSGGGAASSSSHEIRYMMCQPYEKAEVILICDNREHYGNKRGKTVVENLTKSSVRFELRSLSVGDYLWVARKIDGSELVLDWVVERKTWSDLQQSIRKGRYDEQKQRLIKAPMKYRVYLVEGAGEGDVACQQALATTTARDNFLIRRCHHGRDTARFLQSVSQRLMKRVATQQLSGIRFEDLQELSKKTRAETVRDTWVRQLTVCPGMSTGRAQSLASSYPSLPALANAFSTHRGEKTSMLSQALPQIPKALSAQLSKFFQ